MVVMLNMCCWHKEQNVAARVSYSPVDKEDVGDPVGISYRLQEVVTDNMSCEDESDEENVDCDNLVDVSNNNAKQRDTALFKISRYLGAFSRLLRMAL